MTRGHGWRFLDIGRRLERSLGDDAARAQRARRQPVARVAMLEPLLEIADSSMTYRRRYFAEPQLAPVLDLLLADDTNPRALAFQLAALADHLAQLPRHPKAPSPTREERIVAHAIDALAAADFDALSQPGADGAFDRLTGPARSARRGPARRVRCGHLLLLQPCRAACQLRRQSTYEVVHTTRYTYSEAVSVSHHVARLMPRAFPRQDCLRHELQIEPPPAVHPSASGLLRQRRELLHRRACAHGADGASDEHGQDSSAGAGRRRRARRRGRRRATSTRCRSRRSSVCSTRRRSR